MSTLSTPFVLQRVSSSVESNDTSSHHWTCPLSHFPLDCPQRRTGVVLLGPPRVRTRPLHSVLPRFTKRSHYVSVTDFVYCLVFIVLFIEQISMSLWVVSLVDLLNFCPEDIQQTRLTPSYPLPPTTESPFQDS